jgi:hypothetical protein
MGISPISADEQRSVIDLITDLVRRRTNFSAVAACPPA